MKKCFLLFLICWSTGFAAAQENEMETPMPSAPVQELFRSYRLVTGHTVETLYKGDLLVTFSHRFTGPVNDGLETFFGLDQYSDIRFALGYGITDRLSVEVGRTRLGRTYDAQAKYAITRQWDQGGWPLAITVVGQSAARTIDWRPDQESYATDHHRFRYVGQVLLAHQFPFGLRLQLAPTWVHKNLAEARGEVNDTWLLGGGFRIPFTGKLFLSGEIYQPLSNRERDDRRIQPVAGISFDILSPRHAFQIQLTNAGTLVDADLYTGTYRDFFAVNGWLLGFHITRSY